MTALMYLQLALYLFSVFCLYMGGGLVIGFLVCGRDIRIEHEQNREKSKREIKARDEQNRIGFLFRLRDERKERVQCIQKKR